MLREAIQSVGRLNHFLSVRALHQFSELCSINISNSYSAMNNFFVCFILFWIFIIQSVTGSVRGYNSFEEYLEHVVSSNANSDNSAAVNSTGVTTPTSNELLGYFRTVPRQHWSCCMLGLLAGSKGFHCQAQYYLSSGDAAQRNVNRAQTSRQSGAHGRHRGHAGPRWGYSISRSFHRCVGDETRRTLSSDDGVDHEFHNCCYAATEERRQLGRAQRYRLRRQDSLRRR